MDLLTHLFLPIGVAYVLRPDLFPSTKYFGLAVFAAFPDADKLVGLQGLLHSALTLGVVASLLCIVETRLRDSQRYALLVSTLLFSHLLLDILDGGPVPLLYPLIETGVGLQYPAELVIGENPTTSGIKNPLPSVTTDSPSQSRTTYPILSGYGVLSMLVFAIFYLNSARNDSRLGQE